MGSLNGKVAIVTGAARGLGKGEALALAKEGAKVAVLDRLFDEVVQTAKEIEATGGEALPLHCDVTVRPQVRAAVDATAERFGAIDILVNNAQAIYPPHPLLEWTEDEMRDCYESGLLGSWYFMVECFPHMKDRGGKIINFCSAGGHGNVPGSGGYGCAKEAIRSLTRTAAREWGQHRINVNVISPCAMSAAFAEIFPTEEAQQAILRDIGAAVPYLGDAERDIGRAVVYLAGPDSNIITGHTLSVDSGIAMF